MSTTVSTGERPPPTRRRTSRLARRWALTFLAFPPAGLAAIEVVGRVADVPAAVLGGAIAGAGIGVAQAVALWPSSPRLGAAVRWTTATSVAMAVGLAGGAAAVGYATDAGSLAAMGALTGVVLGAVQGVLLRLDHRTPAPLAALWAAAVPALWALGWAVTTAAGVDVGRQYAVFGATGALAVALAGAVLVHLAGLRPRGARP